MSLHISATTGCNLGCTYCYENPDREMQDDWINKEYDMDKIMERLEAWKDRYPHETPGFHGGEPLLMKQEDMETLCEWIYENYNEGGHIQTNATMMTEDHIEMFAKYDWGVGVSIDGPGELNEHRIAYEGGDDVTRKHTERTIKNIKRMREAGVPVNIIVVLHKANAGTDERLERLLDFLEEMQEIGVEGHYNPAIPYEDVQEDISLSPERLKEVYLRTWEWVKEGDNRQWNPMRSYIDNLLGNQLHNCVNDKCDVYNAGAAKIIMGNGETTGCGKTWSGVGDGGKFLQGPSTDEEYNDADERYEMLKVTPGPYDDSPVDMGGCRGCDYWNVCTGGCPSSGMNFDYRNRTIWCEAKYALYEKIEEDLRTLMPNITLVTDYPWDLELNEYASRWQIDIEPFGAMRPGVQGRSSASAGYNHPRDDPYERLPDEMMNELTMEQQHKMYNEKYGEENVVFDEEKGNLHADSDMNKKQNTTTEENTANKNGDTPAATEEQLIQLAKEEYGLSENGIQFIKDVIEDGDGDLGTITINEETKSVHSDSEIEHARSLESELENN